MCLYTYTYNSTCAYLYFPFLFLFYSFIFFFPFYMKNAFLIWGISDKILTLMSRGHRIAVNAVQLLNLFQSRSQFQITYLYNMQVHRPICIHEYTNIHILIIFIHYQFHYHCYCYHDLIHPISRSERNKNFFRLHYIYMIIVIHDRL